jgi:hypothetical protein
MRQVASLEDRAPIDWVLVLITSVACEVQECTRILRDTPDPEAHVSGRGPPACVPPGATVAGNALGCHDYFVVQLSEASP